MSEQKNTNITFSYNNKLKPNTKAHRLIVEEKGYSGELSTLGKIDIFEQHFYNKKLNDSIINRVAKIDNPRKSKSFKEGQIKAISLIKQGFGLEEYAIFLKNINKKLKEKLVETQNKTK